MINAKTWNPAQIDQAIRRLEGIIRSGSYNPAELNQLLNQLGEPGYINTWNPAELDQKLRTLLHDLLSWKTATGNPIQLRTNNGGLVESCEVTFSPIQDLHGQSAPYPAGGGKNLFDNNRVYPTTVNGITFRKNDDGSVSVQGNTPSDNNSIINVSLNLEAGNYLFNGAPNGLNQYDCFVWDTTTGARATKWDGTTASLSAYSKLEEIKIVEGHNYAFNMRINRNVSFPNETTIFYPMICLSTETDETFAPYSNICPISGWDSLHLYQDTEQTETPETTHTSTFPSIVYGGSHEFVSGKAKSEWGYIAEYDGETITDLWISSIDKYVPGTTPSTGAEVCYKLATPTEITLTPEEIELLTGDNVLWTDGDNIEITYKKLLLPSDVELLSKKKIIEEKPKTKRSKKKKEE